MKTKIILWNLLATVILIGSCAKTETESFGRIQGIVSDSKGEPLQAATVTLSPGGKATTTGSDGRYDYADLTPGSYTVQVVKEGFQSNTRQVTVEAGVTVSGDIQLSNAYGAIRGVVKDAETQATIQAATVSIMPGNHSTVTGSDGYYIFNNLASGTYTIQVTGTGYAAYTKLVDVTAGNTASGDILLQYGSGNLKVSKQNLEFGTSDNIGVFEISNNGQYDLAWNIQYDCAWISEITPLAGATKAGNKASVTVKVDRSKLTDSKTQSSTVIIASNGGSAELVVSINGTATPGGDGETVVTANLLAYYTFDEGNAKNAMGTTMVPNGVLNGNPVFIGQTPNGTGKAISIDGTGSQYINIPKNPFIDGKEFSISLWVNGFGEGVLFSGICPSSYDVFRFFPRLVCESNKLSFSVSALVAYPSFNYSATTIQDGKWHMITVVSADGGYSTHTLTLYVDGDMISSVTHNGYSTENLVNDIQFGGNANGKMKATSLKLDNIRLYAKTLTGTEIKTIYEAEK